MSSKYLTDEEYQRYWVKLKGMRTSVSRDLELTVGMKVLDVGTGWGFFAIEMAKQVEKGEIIGIDIVPGDVNRAKELIRKAEVADNVEILRIDAKKLSFPKNCFDLAVSFLGMRDVHMTRGKEGVKETTKEMVRVTKPSGKIALCITPPEDAETEDQKLAIEVEGKVFGAKSLPKKIYADIFRENNVVLKKTKAYYTNKKLTAKQATIELKEGIEIARNIYGKAVPEFKDVWGRYGKKIEAFGYGMYSKIVMLVGEKTT
ncbi:MAG: class I SAM-dependent methyltransferase [Thermoproteota archaeon]|nr:class I SAM-dependent methyltransferase [Thermoproteota archaeon]